MADRNTRKVKLGSFDVVLTNPPFGAKIPVVGDSLLRQNMNLDEFGMKKTEIGSKPSRFKINNRRKFSLLSVVCNC